MKHVSLLLFAVLAVSPAGAAAPRRSFKAVNEENVKKAIRRAVEYLYSIANKDGIWDTMPPPDFTKADLSHADRNWGGKTALVLYALTTAGERNDPRFKKALTLLMKQRLIGTYTVSLRLQLIHQLPNSEQYRSVLLHDGRLMVSGALPAGGGVMWSYTPPIGGRPPGRGDFSNVNYAVLGLWAAGDERFEVPARIWLGLEKSYVASQQKNGGFVYVPGQQVTGSMTTAGIASLYLIIDRYYARTGRLGAFRASPAYKSIQAGLKWMAGHFRSGTNPGRPDWFNTYYFYNCERVGAAAGLKYFGRHDWFREIAAHLLNWQSANGAIAGRTAPQYGGLLVDTAFGLLFLTKGSAPVIVNKLQHAGDWDNHIRELAALTGWLAKQSERPANWQVVNLKVPPEEWTDSRILYVAGTKPLVFQPDEMAKLKRFVELGGLLVFHPDAPSRPFEASVAKLLAAMWPKLELSAVDLASHPLGKIYLPLKGARVRVRQLASPTRILAFLVQGQPADAWERRQYVSAKAMFALGANLHYFANDRSPLHKMPTKLTCFADVFKRKPPRSVGRSVILARIKYGDNPHRWDPEPLAFERFARLLAEREKVRCQVKVVTPEQLAASGAKVAHLTGVDPVEFDPPAWGSIHVWLLTGGTLIVDQAGGIRPARKDTFDTAFRKLMEDRYGKGALGSVPSAHPLLGGLEKVTYRHVMGARRSSMRPRLECVKIAGRPAIVYSRYDLTTGLLGCPNPLAVGLTDKSAYDLVSRLVLAVSGLREKAGK